jgi:glycosyltransferase involved in cell wall biosynthesis
MIVTLHREGALLGVTINSCLAAAKRAASEGISLELVLVMDRSDDTTSVMFDQARLEALFGIPCNVQPTDFGDPGLARNHGVEQASGRYVTFLDGDDLWGSNWLLACHSFQQNEPQPVIAHSNINLVFGGKRLVWMHPSSRDPNMSLLGMPVSNYWDSMAFAERQIYQDFHFTANDLKAGYGHDDWHWYCMTLLAGMHHVPVPKTIHFKRARASSQMALCDVNDAVMKRNPMMTYHSYKDAMQRLGKDLGFAKQRSHRPDALDP